MLVSSRGLAGACALLSGAALASMPAGAQGNFPDRAIKVIVPFPAGGAVDLIARLATAQISKDQGWSFVIENRGGAGGVIATDATAKAAADGYTVLLTTPNHSINAALKAKLPYDTERDLVPVAMVAEVPLLLVSHPGAPFSDFKGFLAYAKANPGKLNYSSAGNGTLPHVAFELLLKLADAKVVHVAYRGAAPALTDTIVGVVQLKYDTYATSRELVAAGKLKALAFATPARSALMPEVPTVMEHGFPGYQGTLWNALVAPAASPPAAIAKLHSAVVKAVAAPGLLERFSKEGMVAGAGSPDAIKARIAAEIAQWRDLARSSNIVID